MSVKLNAQLNNILYLLKLTGFSGISHLFLLITQTGSEDAKEIPSTKMVHDQQSDKCQISTSTCQPNHSHGIFVICFCWIFPYSNHPTQKIEYNWNEEYLNNPKIG